MELLKSKESCKEKFDSNNNWKTAWPRMILEWHLFLRLSLGFVWKMLSFVGKHLSFYQRCLLIFCFSYLNEKESNQQVCLIRYVENEISNSTSHKKGRERGGKTKSNFKSIGTFTLTKIWKTEIGVKFWILLLLQMSYIFIVPTKDLNVVQTSTEN